MLFVNISKDYSTFQYKFRKNTALCNLAMEKQTFMYNFKFTVLTQTNVFLKTRFTDKLTYGP